MASLYELSAEFRHLERLLLEPHIPGVEGEDVAEIEQAFGALIMERQEKLKGCIAVYRNMKAEQEAVQREVERLNAREAHLDKRAKGFANYIANCLSPGERFSCPIGTIGWRASEAVEGEYGDDTEVPQCYQRIMKKVMPDKARMKQDLKIGATIPGWTLKQRSNLVIK